MTGIVESVREFVRPHVLFVEAFLGLWFLLGATVLALPFVLGEPLPEYVLGGLALGLTLVGTYPFVTERWSTDRLGTYLLGFVVGVFGTVLAELLWRIGTGAGGVNSGAVATPVTVAVAHVVGFCFLARHVVAGDRGEPGSRDFSGVDEGRR